MAMVRCPICGGEVEKELEWGNGMARGRHYYIVDYICLDCGTEFTVWNVEEGRDEE